MRNLIAIVTVVGLALVAGMVVYTLTTQTSPQPETPGCIEYSRDGSYCFRQSLE